MFDKLTARLRNYRYYRASLAKLQSMDERMLKDLGLTRGNLEAALRGDISDRSSTSARSE